MLTITNQHLLLVVKERHYTDVGGSEGELRWISSPKLKHINIRSKDIPHVLLVGFVARPNLHNYEQVEVLVFALFCYIWKFEKFDISEIGSR